MDKLLVLSKSLYKDRQRIALATMMIIFTFAFYVFYSPGIYGLGTEPPANFPYGWTQGFEVVYSFNTVGFFLAFALMVLAYGFWSWAFLPTPAVTYTMGILRGIFGQSAKIKQSFGKRFKILLDSGDEITLTCRLREHGSGDWFVYRLESSIIQGKNAEEIALRHGMSLKKKKFVSWVGNDELHGRMLLLAKAISLSAM
ncbi:MAG: hypothetical protein ACTSV2_05530 [Candidatus Thorarchaeota archaeon]